MEDVAVVGYPGLLVLPPMMFTRVAPGLMAGPAQRACGTGVANLDLVSMCPAVPDLAPTSRFGVAPVRGADTGFCHWGGSHWCGRG